MGGETAVSVRIVRTVADREGVTPDAVPPLYGVIDPDVLDDLVERSSTAGLVIEFTYAGYDVTVDGADEPVVTVESARGSVHVSKRKALHASGKGRGTTSGQ